MLNKQYKFIQSYVHKNRIGVLVEYGMRSELTPRVAEVQNLMSDIALHIAASDPVDVEDLFDQPFVKDPDKKVSDMFDQLLEAVSEKISVIRFVRWDTEKTDPEPDDPPSEPSTNVVYIRGIR